MDLARELKLMFVETSAKTNAGINELFENLLEIILDERSDNNAGDTEVVNAVKNKPDGGPGSIPPQYSKY
jgi:GTPase SAR1 family protein